MRRPSRWHSASSQSRSRASRSRPGGAPRSAAPRRCGSPRSASRTRWTRPARTRAASRPAGPPPTTSTSRAPRVGALLGRVLGLVAAAGVAGAGDQGIAGVAHPAGLIAQQAGPGYCGPVLAQLGDQLGVGDLGQGHLDQVAGAAVQRGLGRGGSTTLPCSTTGTTPASASRTRRAQGQLNFGGGARRAGRRGRIGAAADHDQQVQLAASSGACSAPTSGVIPAQGASSSQDRRRARTGRGPIAARTAVSTARVSRSRSVPTRRPAGWSGPNGTGGAAPGPGVDLDPVGAGRDG